jgi:hypothetical protein
MHSIIWFTGWRRVVGGDRIRPYAAWFSSQSLTGFQRGKSVYKPLAVHVVRVLEAFLLDQVVSTLGFARSRDASGSTMAAPTTTRVNLLLSAGTT